MAAEKSIPPGTLVGDRFEIECVAGTGGMGEVYRARDRLTGDLIAVKFVRQTAESYAARFEREARALAQFAHPAIVRYIEHGKQPSVFLAMEWLEGEDLAKRLLRGPLTINDTLVLARRAADALAAAHARQIVHRDIKPSNIFLVNNRIEDAKLLDFGVAQVAKSTYAITGTGQMIGTLGYMAPEQALSGRDVTPAADVFSLGCVLFECITGRAPFTGEWAEVLSKILLSEPPRLRELRRDVPHAIDELLTRMLRKDPLARASLAAVSADIATFLSVGTTALGGASSDVAISTVEVPAVTGDERKLLAVIVASESTLALVSKEPNLTPSADTMPNSTVHLGQVVAKFDGKLEVLPDGTPLVSLTSTSTATDLAARAARCALAMRDVLPKSRIAVASGRGDPSHSSVIDEVVARAQKLLTMDSGARGEKPVRIDQVTAGLLDASFEVSGDAGGLALIGRRERNSVRKLLGKPTPCVGRERELSMLNGLVAECFAEPLATALLIVANAGVGKSRLRYEILRALRDREDSPEIWMARGDPITTGSPFGMLSQLLRGIAGLVDGELIEVRRQKLLARVGRNLPIEDATRIAQFLGELVRAEFSGEDRPGLRAARQDPSLMNDQLRRSWEDFVAAETAAGPLVIVLEDLQWGDLPTVRFVDAVLRTQRHRPLLVLALGRPEVHEAFPGLFRDRRLNEVHLSDLTPSASRKLVLDVLGASADPSLVDNLVEKANGNAFYLEELIRAAVEGTSAMPGTVLAMIQARLERLEPGARRLLRAASVFGARFWVGGVASLLGADGIANVEGTLDDLVQREFIMPNAASRFKGDAEYTFRHALVRDAAYEMLTERDRKTAHLLAAEWLEARGEREALVLAEHLERSGERQRAVVWYLWAAEQALEGNDLASVLVRGQRGIECGAQGQVLGELYLLTAEASGWAGLATHLELAEKAMELLPEGSPAWARAAAELAVACRGSGDRDRLRETAEKLGALDLGDEKTGPSMGHVWGLARTVVELLGAGESQLSERLIASIERSSKHADEADAKTLRAIIDWLRAAVALYAGAPADLLAMAGEVAKTFEEAGHVRYSTLVALHAAIASASAGDWSSGVLWAERAADLARRLGLRSFELRARAWMALHFARTGNVDIALATAMAAVRDSTGNRVAEGEAHVHLAHIHLASRDMDAAYEAAGHVWKDPSFSADARGRAGGILAQLLLLRDRVDEALEMANESLGVLEHVRPLGDSEVRVIRAEALARANKDGTTNTAPPEGT